MQENDIFFPNLLIFPRHCHYIFNFFSNFGVVLILSLFQLPFLSISSLVPLPLSHRLYFQPFSSSHPPLFIHPLLPSVIPLSSHNFPFPVPPHLHSFRLPFFFRLFRPPSFLPFFLRSSFHPFRFLSPSHAPFLPLSSPSALIAWQTR